MPPSRVGAELWRKITGLPGCSHGVTRRLLFVLLVALPLSHAAPSPYRLEESLDIGRVPAGFRVGFDLLTAGERQYVAYYDHQRRMTVGSRLLDSDEWQYQVLPSKIGWDSHNYITMAVDDDGHLHVSGNMHCVKLIYFRTEKPGDISTLKRLPMTGKLEDRVTYPKFLRDHEGSLVFTYRHGGSGRGMRIYNRYDLKTRSWSRLLGTPLLDGEGERNAYPRGPVRGPDGWFHLVWVWRDTPDCETNHHLSHARSRDLVNWESVFGDRVELPLVLDEERLWVDPVPPRGGIINGCQKLFFDSKNRPVIAYHKSDERGNMQIYAARPENGEWSRHRLTDWAKPIEFSGRGSMPFIGIWIEGLKPVAPGLLALPYRHRDYGSGRLLIDEESLQRVKRDITIPREYPKELPGLQSDFKGMGIRRASDAGDSGDPDVRYLLQWETLGSHHDRPRKPPLPEPSMLRLHKLVRDR